MKYTVILFLGFTLVVMPYLEANGIEIKSEEDKINYSIGYQIGGDFKKQGIKLNSEAVVKGIEDATTDDQPLLSEEEIRTTLIMLKKRIVADQEAEIKLAKANQQEAGVEFLAANSKKEGVVVLPSGLQYKVITTGTGKQPTLDDTVTVHYRGTRINGSIFSNTYRVGKPDSIELAKVIPGLQEALPMMKEGAKWELYIPANLAFGERGPLEGNAVIYEVELLAVQPKN